MILEGDSWQIELMVLQEYPAQYLGCFYVMMNINKTLNRMHNGRVLGSSLDFADALLESKNVAVVPGIAFGADGYVRLSYATSKENIDEGLNRIESFVKELV